MNLSKIFKLITRKMNDEMYLRIAFRIIMKRKLDLKNPKTLNEKIQWLKLNNRNPMLTSYVDKFKVKNIIAELIGEQYIIPTLGVWKKFEDIDFSKLPNQFVLKCNHDSHSVVICKDKSKFDYKYAKNRLEAALKKNYFWHGREWAYKNVEPLIIAEQYMVDNNTSEELTDYKFFCFRDYVDSVMVCYNREAGEPKYYFFDKNWNLLRDYNRQGKEAPKDFYKEKPINFEKMCELASVLSMATQVPFVRVDFYNINGNPYFGELTFSPTNGLDYNLLYDTDLHFGKLIDLSLIKDQ